MMKDQIFTMTQKVAKSSTNLSASMEELAASTNEITIAADEVDKQMEKKRQMP